MRSRAQQTRLRVPRSVAGKPQAAAIRAEARIRELITTGYALSVSRKASSVPAGTSGVRRERGDCGDAFVSVAFAGTCAGALAVRGAAFHHSAIMTSLRPARAGLRATLLASVWVGALGMSVPATAQVSGTWTAPLPNPQEWTQGTNWSSNPDVPDTTATFTNNACRHVGHDLEYHLDWHHSVHICRAGVFLRRQFCALRNQWPGHCQQFRVRAEFH